MILIRCILSFALVFCFTGISYAQVPKGKIFNIRTLMTEVFSKARPGADPKRGISGMCSETGIYRSCFNLTAENCVAVEKEIYPLCIDKIVQPADRKGIFDEYSVLSLSVATCIGTEMEKKFRDNFNPDSPSCWELTNKIISRLRVPNPAK